MAQTISTDRTECETCGGVGELIGDGVDGAGERVDAVETCTDCGGSGDFDDSEPSDRERRECEYFDRQADQYAERLAIALGPAFLAELA